ncbi:MAG: transketolase [Zetaproteobacteria bacterium]|nr:transketolase [Pseudobdellovibrionaceae bacterium]
MLQNQETKKNNNTEISKEDILSDYRVCYQSRQMSLIGRKEVLSGKAKFGIFGDGKELAQVAMARVFTKGDWRSGYYRDQTFMLALKETTVRQFFSQLYADSDIANDPASSGRQMSCHYASRFLDSEGNWKHQTQEYNTASDLSPTGGQMARLLGLGYASKLYKDIDELKNEELSKKFSFSGQEVAFGTIGNASTSEGLFWETMNGAGVLQVPLALFIWDDDYGISVPTRYQTTKESIYEIMKGFIPDDKHKGIELYQVEGNNYSKLLSVYKKAVSKTRKEHSPCLIHVTHITQPQGHSTSGSHERYKSEERLNYEKSIDCLPMFRAWIINQKFATENEMTKLEEDENNFVMSEQKKAWDLFQNPIKKESLELTTILNEMKDDFPKLKSKISQLEQQNIYFRKTIQSVAKQSLWQTGGAKAEKKGTLLKFIQNYEKTNENRYNSYFFNSFNSPLAVKEVPPSFNNTKDMIDGRLVINRYFDHVLNRDPRVFIIGEDVGKLGGVNLEFEGLQNKYGELRVTDTGIREATILGQGVGAALRGLRPIVDIQYLDYLIYCLQGLSDDVATLHYRTAGGQTVPVIIRTKGHRLEGIWHTGSPMQMLLGSLRGVHLCVPRNCAQAAGMYQTLLRGDDPGLVIEVLNGYRVKEDCPNNLGSFSIPLGVPEILKEGSDITVVTYGANVRIAEAAIKHLENLGVDVELIDVRTLLPFDTKQMIAQSIQKTNAIVFFDEDVSGGASAYMMQKVLEEGNAYNYLDSMPRTLSAKDHRSPYASDGDYYSKPNAENLVELVYKMMRERKPHRYEELN